MGETGIEISKITDEIERKYLVAALPENLEQYSSDRISQGYIVVGEDGSEARLRNREGVFTLTVKSAGDLVRPESTVFLTPEQFNTLWPCTEGKRVEKTRYSIPYGDALIELDIYEGDLSGLVTVEVEFPDKASADAFEAPEWFGDEVTTNRAYKNQNLALSGRPS